MPRYNQPPPQRQPFSYVPNGSFHTPPMSKKQGEMGVRNAERSLIRPATAPPAYPIKPNPFPLHLPMGTAIGDGGYKQPVVRFTMGSIRLHVSVRRSVSLLSPFAHKRLACLSLAQREIGSSAKSPGVRAFVSAQSSIIMYQMVVPLRR